MKRLLFSLVSLSLVAALGSAQVQAKEEKNPFAACEAFFKDSQFTQAKACYARPLIDGSDEIRRRALMCKAETDIALGFFTDGFKAYDARLKDRAPLTNAWDGLEDLRDKRILVRCEMGLGDTFFLFRYIPMLIQLGAIPVIYLGEGTQFLLKTILSYCPYLDKSNIVTGKEKMPTFYKDVYLMSLPRYLAYDPTTKKAILGATENESMIPTIGQYIHTDHERIKFFHAQISPKTFNIGICWRAGKLPPSQVKLLERDIPLALLAELGKIEGVKLYNLLTPWNEPIKKSTLAQRKAAGEFEGEKGQEKLKGLMFDVVADDFPMDKIVSFPNFDKVGAFVDTAAVITSMDIIISCDTSVGCLTGAMNKPLFLVLPNKSDFRWGQYPRPDSPWIKSATLFWQDNQGDWSAPIHKVTELVKKMAKKKVGRN